MCADAKDARGAKNRRLTGRTSGPRSSPGASQHGTCAPLPVVRTHSTCQYLVNHWSRMTLPGKVVCRDNSMFRGLREPENRRWLARIDPWWTRSDRADTVGPGLSGPGHGCGRRRPHGVPTIQWTSRGRAVGGNGWDFVWKPPPTFSAPNKRPLEKKLELRKQWRRLRDAGRCRLAAGQSRRPGLGRTGSVTRPRAATRVLCPGCGTQAPGCGDDAGASSTEWNARCSASSGDARHRVASTQWSPPDGLH